MTQMTEAADKSSQANAAEQTSNATAPRKRGRPRKYATDEERKEAIRRQKREWRERQKLKNKENEPT